MNECVFHPGTFHDRVLMIFINETILTVSGDIPRKHRKIIFILKVKKKKKIKVQSFYKNYLPHAICKIKIILIHILNSFIEPVVNKTFKLTRAWIFLTIQQITPFSRSIEKFRRFSF